jgi:hypothetical protein
MEGNLPENKKNSLLFRKVFESSRFDIKKPIVEGFENIPLIPCIIATTHLSDIDVQEIAMVVADRRKIGMVSQETNLTFPPSKPFIALIGKDNFFPIANTLLPEDHNKSAYSLRIDDLRGMEDGIKKNGRTMIMAGHNHTRDWKLAENPGIAAIILAHKAGVPLVPAVLDIDSKNPIAQMTNKLSRVKNFVTLKRPSAKIIFCEPMNLAEISEDKLRAAIDLYSPDARRNMTPQQIATATETLEILQKEASQMMESFASKLPPEKRGKWSKEIK